MQTSDGNTRLNSDEDRLAGVKGVGGGVVCKAGAPSCSPEPHAHHQCDDVTCEVLKNQLNSVFGTAANPVPSSSLPKCVVIGADHDLLCNALQACFTSCSNGRGFDYKPHFCSLLKVKAVLAKHAFLLQSTFPEHDQFCSDLFQIVTTRLLVSVELATI